MPCERSPSKAANERPVKLSMRCTAGVVARLCGWPEPGGGAAIGANNTLDSTMGSGDDDGLREAEDFWFLMHQSDDPDRRTMALTCYCDDSGSHEESVAAVVGGVVLDKDRFIRMNVAWDKILHDFKIDKVHMKDFVRPHGRFCTMQREMKLALFSSVADAILESKLYTLSASVPQAEFKSLLSQEVYRKFMGPYALAFLVAVSINIGVLTQTDSARRMAYLIDKGTNNHHEQLQGAHTALLHMQRKVGDSYIGPMTEDLDDYNCGLQASDVIAWSHHRKLSAGDFGEDFVPLLSLLTYKLPYNNRTKIHFTLDLPHDGIELFARLVNDWIKSEGKLYSWSEVLQNNFPGIV